MPDYYKITEKPGLKATNEQLERLYQRYHFIKPLTIGKNVLEVACGSGLGLKYLADTTKSITGIDIDDKNIELAKEICNDSPFKEKINILKMDAHDLSFQNNSFDVIILSEAIYYLKDVERFIEESFRVLQPNGLIFICSVNKDWEDFHPSPYTYKYFSVNEFNDLLKGKFKNIRAYGGFKVDNSGLRKKIVSMIKRYSVSLNIIPGSLAARAFLKSIFIGKVHDIPNEIFDKDFFYENPLEIDKFKINKVFTIIYILAEINK